MNTSDTRQGSRSAESPADTTSGHPADVSGDTSDRATEQPPGGQRPPPSERLPKDVVFDLLSAERRRRVLRYLAEEGPQTRLTNLAEFIAARENDTEIRLISSQQRKRVYVALYQTHLPRLADAEVIDYDSSRGTVELRPTAAELFRFMDVTPGSSDQQAGASGDPLSKGINAVRTTLDRLIDG